MKFDLALQPLRDASNTVAFACRRMSTHPLLAQISLRLDQVAASELPRERPLIAALIGGTGAGKSHLFNALIGQPEASPTSPDIRPKTAQVVLARRPVDHALLPEMGAGAVRFIDAALPGMALADTPDIDGLWPEHWATAQRAIEVADVIVYVAIHERQNNERVVAKVREWAPRKRWFFVMNQIDRHTDKEAGIRAEFDRLLREQGFAPDDGCRFIVSATQPERWDFARLRDTLLSERPREASAALAVDSVVGQVLHACGRETESDLTILRKQIVDRQKALSIQLVERIKDAIEKRKIAHQLLPLLRKQLWVALPGKVGGPLALPVAIHARFSALASAFQLWRLTTAGFSFWRLGLLFASVAHALRGSIELRGLISQLDDELADELDSQSAAVRLFLEDRHLVPPVASADSGLDEELQQIVSEVPKVGASLARVVGALLGTGAQGRVARELAPLLAGTIAQRAEEAATNAVSWLARLMNVLPLAALAHAAYELVATWLDQQWLPGSFYLHAMAIFALTLLPGYLLVYLGALRQLRQVQTLSALLGAADHLRPCGPAAALALLAVDLESILAGLRTLRAQAASLRSAIDAEYGTAALGATTHHAHEGHRPAP